MNRNVYVIGSYSSRFGKWPNLTHKDLMREAYINVPNDSGIEPAYVGRTTLETGTACW